VNTPAAKEISDWLEKLGMSEYAQRFAENDIDLAVLGDLTDQDLKELGVASLGHRRKLLRAIADLSFAEKETSKSGAATAAAAPPQDTAERRQVTVMFSDLVGSTALSARMDPEDLREIISAYQKCVAETVRRFGGFVAKYMGDGVLVYFGYPRAHEDDAELGCTSERPFDPADAGVRLQQIATVFVAMLPSGRKRELYKSQITRALPHIQKYNLSATPERPARPSRASG